MKAALRLIYPPQCIACGTAVDATGALCPECWRDCDFITGCACDLCGVPLPGLAGQQENGADLRCDDCLTAPPPWQRGRAALVYGDVGRALALSLKHADRPDLAEPLGAWLSNAASALIAPGMIVAPIPLHPTRMMKRRYNQAALLSDRLARAHGLTHLPGLLRRIRATGAQDHRSHAERHRNLEGAIAVAPRHRDRIAGRPVLLVDDVMASGATLDAASRALAAARAGPVSVAVLARAVKTL